MKKEALLLISIIIFAAFLRFWHLGQNPPSLTWDEAAWGYNAYSLGIDGKDEFGKFLPTAFLESFGDFKPPLYAYLTIIPIKIFGLTEFATRFASAFFGVGTVFLTYFLVLEVFKDKKLKALALQSALILAISPWHILLSRAAFEANVANFFIVFGIYLFLKAVNGKKILIIFSILSFVLSMYTFNTARIVTPLLVAGLIIFKLKPLIKMKKEAIIAFIIGFIVFSPLAFFLSTPQSRLRFNEVNIFSDASVIERANTQVSNDNNSFFSRFIHNRRFAYSAEYIKHYFDNLDPSFLFIKGDGNPKFSIQDVGQMYLWEIPFFLFGLFLIFKKRQGDWWIIPLWIVTAIAPAATARETPHALRIESALPMFQILTAYGLYYLIFDIKRIKFKYFLSGVVVIFVVFNFIYFIHNYFTHYPREFSGEWQYGYKEAIGYVRENQNKYDEIFFTRDLGRPYIYFLFYLGYDPKAFRSEANITREVYGFVHVGGFGKFKFPELLTRVFDLDKKKLYIDTPGRVPKGAKIVKEFYLLNGNKVLAAYE